ncbi:MAG: AgmX/PglI C-terminal domain-containing protein [Candidatus Lernaella stagnicola]|nr:AgmX/PglI C-terminal domain-containing protein [Candidatus Lernaella stagnicola]
MPTPSREELRAEIPFISIWPKWNRIVIAALCCSLLAHVAFVNLVRLLPPPPPAPRIATAMFVPQFQLPEDFELPTSSPKAALTVAPRGSQPGPGSADGHGPAGPVASVESKGMLKAIDQNQHLIALITRESDTPGWAKSVDRLSATKLRPRAGVRVATNGDRLPIGAGPAQAVIVNLPGLDVPKTGTVDTGKRDRRLVHATVGSERPTTSGGDVDERRLVRQALYARRGAVKYCYEKALKTKPHLAGKLSVQVVFAPGGAVQTVAVVADTLGDAGVAACVLAKLRGAKVNGTVSARVTATVPFVFAAVE